MWYQSIFIPYYKYIQIKDETYFLNKDYQNEYIPPGSANIQYITNKCKTVYIKLDDIQKQLLWAHLDKLSQLSSLYFQ